MSTVSIRKSDVHHLLPRAMHTSKLQ